MGIAALSILALSSLAPFQASPPLVAGPRVAGHPVRPALAGAVRAVVVKSWANGGASAWPQLNVEWPQHGSIPMEIDHVTLSDGDFTYESLVASGADVVILSDPAGGLEQFTHEEIEAVGRYAAEGHNLIGTFKVFRHQQYDNSALAPLFGLRADLAYSGLSPALSNEFHVLVDSPLLAGLVSRGTLARRPNQWRSQGYAFSEVPGDDFAWNAADLAGARAVAQCDARRGIVTVYKAPAYVGIFVSNMPEYFGGFDDKQLLYNAIVHPRPAP